jgi:outer membrane murein-binding lipoprotein Lpp
MSQHESGNVVHVTFSGANSGQLVAGTGNTAIFQQTAVHGPVTEADLTELRSAVDRVRDAVDAEPLAPAAAAKAREKLDDLEEAVTAAEPDLSTMEHVRNWFGKNLPRLAGLVAGIVIHPVVGRLAEAAGDALATEFRRRFTPE